MAESNNALLTTGKALRDIVNGHIGRCTREDALLTFDGATYEIDNRSGLTGSRWTMNESDVRCRERESHGVSLRWVEVLRIREVLRKVQQLEAGAGAVAPRVDVV